MDRIWQELLAFSGFTDTVSAPLTPTKGAARLKVPIRQTNRYQQYYMPSQHTYCRRVWNLIKACDVQLCSKRMGRLVVVTNVSLYERFTRVNSMRSKAMQ